MAELLYLETCSCDYFSGFGGHVYSVVVTCSSTYKDVRDELINCIDAEEVLDLEASDYASLKSQCYEVFSDCNLNSIWSPLVQRGDNSGEFSVYAYFGIKS